MTRLERLRDLLVLVMLAPLLTALKMVLASLYNIELVSLMIMVITYKFGIKALIPVYIFSVTEVLIYGINIWNVMYLYVWVVLVLICLPFRKIRRGWFFALISGIFGLSFGALCSIPYYFIPSFGPSFAISWTISGFFPADVLHCVGNTATALLLYIPLTKALDKVIPQKTSSKRKDKTLS